YSMMVAAVGLGIILGGRVGFICSAIGVLAGLAWIIISSVKHGGSSAYEDTEVRMLVLEAHARALPRDDCNFDLFLNVWLTNQTEFDLGIKEIQLTITASDSSSQWSGLQSTRLAERITGDLDRWHLGKEREHTNMRNIYLRAAHHSMPEL